jgi:DNA polymerase III subunit delta'
MTMHFHKTQQDLILQAFKAGRNSHAQLFYGPPGNGKLEAALWYASLMLCLHPTEDGPCGTCSSCMQNKSFTHPDLQFIFPTPKSKSDKIEGMSIEFISQWREILGKHAYSSIDDWRIKTGYDTYNFEIRINEAQEINKNLSYKSYSGGYKVVLIWLPEMLNIEASNKILKNIEEPEDRTIMLMVSEQINRVLPTIRSRVQSVFFPPLQVEDLAQYLRNRGVGEADEIARISEGNIQRAYGFLEADSGVKEMGALFARWMRVCYAVNMKEILSISDFLSKGGKNYSENFLKFSLQIIREALLLGKATGIDGNNPIFADSDFKISNFSKLINPDNTQAILAEIDRAVYEIGRTMNIKIVITDVSIRMHYLMKKGVLPPAFG